MCGSTCSSSSSLGVLGGARRQLGGEGPATDEIQYKSQGPRFSHTQSSSPHLIPKSQDVAPGLNSPVAPHCDEIRAAVTKFEGPFT
jgi:hypothetical protein